MRHGSPYQATSTSKGCWKTILVLVVLAYLLDSTVEARGGRGGGGRGASRGRGGGGGGFSFGSRGTGFKSHGGRSVGSFRGAGFRTYKSSSPAVSGNMISSSIFSRGIAGRGILYSGGGGVHTKERKEKDFSRKSHGWMVGAGVGAAAGMAMGSGLGVIANPETPIKVSSMLYYWKPEYMPGEGMKTVFLTEKNEVEALIEQKNASCSVLATTVEGYGTVCVVPTDEKMERCNRSISMLSDDRIREVSFNSVSKPSHLSWMCPAGNICCEWECCEPESYFNDETIGTIIILFLVVSPLLFIMAFMAYIHGDDLIKINRADWQKWRSERRAKRDAKRKMNSKCHYGTQNSQPAEQPLNGAKSANV